jgi:hypothetical protein
MIAQALSLFLSIGAPVQTDALVKAQPNAAPPSASSASSADTASSPSQSADQTSDDRKSDSGPPLEGLWPSRRLTESLLSRWADEAAARYELDDEQEGRFREALVDRWTGFLEENRPMLQPLANEFLEMRLGVAPPDAKQVQEWSGRAQPAFDKLRAKLRESQDDFREVLRPMQRAKFEVDALKTAAGLQMAEYKLQKWSKGQVEEGDLWQPLPSMRKDRGRPDRNLDDRAHAAGAEGNAQRGGGAVSEAANGGAKSIGETAEPPDQIAAELTAWEKYAAEFIVRHDLDEGQRTAVVSCLHELSERARLHRDLHRDEIARLERRIAEADEGDVGEIREKLVELYGPVDEMFAELETRLEAIPTIEQKARAAEVEKQAPAGRGEPRVPSAAKTPPPPD